MRLLIFHLGHAFGNAEGLENLIIRKTIVSRKISRSFYAPVNFGKAIWLL